MQVIAQQWALTFRYPQYGGVRDVLAGAAGRRAGRVPRDLARRDPLVLGVPARRQGRRRARAPTTSPSRRLSTRACSISGAPSCAASGTATCTPSGQRPERRRVRELDRRRSRPRTLSRRTTCRSTRHVYYPDPTARGPDDPHRDVPTRTPRAAGASGRTACCVQLLWGDRRPGRRLRDRPAGSATASDRTSTGWRRRTRTTWRCCSATSSGRSAGSPASASSTTRSRASSDVRRRARRLDRAPDRPLLQGDDRPQGGRAPVPGRDQGVLLHRRPQRDADPHRAAAPELARVPARPVPDDRRRSTAR